MVSNTQVDSIIARCTAPGRAALALLRICGNDALSITDQCTQLSRGKTIATQQSHTIVYGNVVAQDGVHIDQVMFLIMHGPRTFTGQDTVEITCHNNPFIIQSILERFCQAGARMAQPGEFTQRAVYNGKMDLLQAEALHELITAPSQAMTKASLAQLEGSLSHVMHEVEQELVTLAGFVEASFEFSEEEHMDLDFDAAVRDRFAQVIATIQKVCDGQNTIQHLREGVRIALIGSVNAGKSTLLNCLLGRKRAIVSHQAGTTRDSIEAGMSKNGQSWTFIDTAGIRETDDVIEKEGIVRSHEAAQSADCVIIVWDSLAPHDAALTAVYHELCERYADKAMVVMTKVEEEGAFEQVLDSHFFINAHTGSGIPALQHALEQRITKLYEQADTPYVLNQRQLALLQDVQKRLVTLQAACGGDVAYEIVAAQLHDVIGLLTQLVGRSVSEKVMDTVFSTFCIGK